MSRSSRVALVLIGFAALLIPACAFREDRSILPCNWFGSRSDYACDFDPVVDRLAKEIDHLEHHIDKYGSITAKTPAIWGEARLTRHRREFEEQMAGELTKFDTKLNGFLARSDQAYLSYAMSLSMAASGKVAQYQDAKGNPISSTQIGVITPPSISSSNAGALVPGIAPAVPSTTQAAGAFTTPSSTTSTNVYQSQPFSMFPVANPFSALTSSGPGLSLEPTVVLDQRARYLNHLHEIRRINEGDDTSDSPGYALYLVRVPISVMPGSTTRTGHGAEITLTINSQYGEELLPKTFRSLVVNDLVDLLGTVTFEWAKTKYETFDTGAPPKAASAIEMRQDVVLANAVQEEKKPQPTVAQFRIKSTISKVALDNLQRLDATARAGGDAYPQMIQKLRESVTAKKGNLISTSNSRRSRQALPPSQISPILGGTIEVVADQALSARKSEHFEADVILDIHKTLSAELDAAYDLLCQQGVRELVWTGPEAKGLAESIRRNDMAEVCKCQCWFRDKIKSTGKNLSDVTFELAWAVFVESALLNERLIEDMTTVSTEKGGMALPANTWVPFFGPNPPPLARTAFQHYVAIRWPTHVFALDPVTQEENIADEFSRRRETQFALATAFMTGNMGVGTFTRYSRRLETDMATIALHRTAVGFTKGANHFGWRFLPRFQTPPIEGNLTVITRDLILGGPTRDQELAKAQIEPGMRECVALVIMPTFVSNITVDSSSHWFCLTRPGFTSPHIKNTMRLSESIQRLQDCTIKLCDSPFYRSGEGGRLMQKVQQLSASLPLQTFHQQVPYENTLGGFAMFTSGITDLAPQLYGFYGQPGIKLGTPTELILVGNHFSVRDTQVVAGNRRCDFDLLSRRVMRVTIPGDAQPVVTKAKDSDGKDVEKYHVDIHVIAPYGATAKLPVPVVDGCPTAGSPHFAWGLPRTYKVGYTFDQKADLKTSVAKIVGNLLPTTNEMLIDAPHGMLLPGATNTTLTLILSDGPRIVQATDITVTYDFQRNRFVLFGSNFQTAQKTLSDNLQAYLQNINGGATPNPADRTLTLSGRLFINTNTFATVDSSVQISLTKQ